MPLTMPEELLLLMLDEASGRIIDHATPAGEDALVAAMLGELALASRIDAGAQPLRVLDATPLGDPELDAMLRRLDEAPAPQDAQDWISQLAPEAPALRDRFFARLVAHGILREEDSRFLWVFPERRYPAVSGREERAVKARLFGVIFEDAPPGPRDRLLLGLARATGLLSLILAPEELERARPRIAAVAGGEPLVGSLDAALREGLEAITRAGYLS